MHITIRQLQVFEAVARHLSYTRAAEELHLTQPAVSMQIKQMESSIGLPMFEQIGKKIYLTQAGDAMLVHARTIMRHLEAASEEMNDLRGEDSGRLRVCDRINRQLLRYATSRRFFAGKSGGGDLA